MVSRPRLTMPVRNRVPLVWMWSPLLLTALVRALWMATYAPDPIGSIDSEGFHLLAVNLLDGRGFSIAWDAPFCPNTVRTPLYPLYLAGVYWVFGRFPYGAALTQILLEVLTTAWVIVLTKVMRTGPRARRTDFAPLIAGLLYALNGTTQRYTGQLLSEALLLPVLAGAIYITLRLIRNPNLRYAFLAGSAWGLAVLTKPNVQYLAVTACGLVLIDQRWRLLRRRNRPVSIALWVSLLLVLLPWCARNRAIAGRWTVSTAFEENVARVSAVATQAALLGLDVEPWTETWEYLYRRIALTAGWDVREEARLSCSDRLRQQHEIALAARRVVGANLGTYARSHLWNVMRSVLDPGHWFWYRLLFGEAWETTGVVADIFGRVIWSLERGAVGDALRVFCNERLVHIPWRAAMLWWGLVGARLGVIALSLRGVLYQARRNPVAALLLLGVVLYHIVLPGSIAHDRFYVPAIPIVCVLVTRGAEGYNDGHYCPTGYRRPREGTTTSGGPND